MSIRSGSIFVGVGKRVFFAGICRSPQRTLYWHAFALAPPWSHLHGLGLSLKSAVNAMLSVVYIDTARVISDCCRLAFANANRSQGCLSRSPNASQYESSSCFPITALSDHPSATQVRLPIPSYVILLCACSCTLPSLSSQPPQMTHR